MKRFAIITTHPIQYYAPIFKRLTDDEIECKVFYTWGEGGIKDKFDPDFKKIIEWDIPLLEGYNFEFCKNTSKKPGTNHFNGIINPYLIQSILDFEPTHILIFGWNFSSHLKVLRYFKGKIPVLFRGDSTLIDDPNGFSFKSLARKYFLTWIYQHVDFALYVGQANKAYYKKFGLKEEQLIFAPHAIDNDRFSLISHQQQFWIEKIKQEFSIQETDITIIFCGKFQDKKNPFLLLEAVKELSINNLHLIFVGNGKLESKLKAYQNKNIHFLPFQNQTLMPAVYRLGDIFCLPSQGPRETWGLAVNEAMACSRAVLVSDKCGCAVDLIEDGENGYVFESNNINDLINKIKLLTVDKKSVKNMGNNSFKIIQDWSFDKINLALKKY